MQRLVVGIDVSQDKVDVAYFCNQEPTFVGVFQNNSQGFSTLCDELEKIKQSHRAQSIHLIMEPTGGYEQFLARFALRQNWLVSLPNPKHLRKWANGIGIRAKTDRTDAMMLARYGAIMNPPLWSPPSRAIEELDHLLSRLEELEVHIQAERNRVHAHKKQPVQSEIVLDNLTNSISFLDKQIQHLQEAISQFFIDHPPLLTQKQQLQSVFGVGEKNSRFLVVLFHRFAQLTDGKGSAKSITAFVGLDPVPFESGSSVRKRRGISREGNKRLRRYLYLGALGGTRGNNPLTVFYQRLVKRGKPKKLALLAAARKILVWSWSIFQSQQTFDALRFQLQTS